MFGTKVNLVGQPQQFLRPVAAPLARRRPASPVTLQTLTESLVSLNEKVDALTRTAQQSRQAVPVESTLVQAKPVVSREVEVEADPSEGAARQPVEKLNRSRLREFFD